MDHGDAARRINPKTWRNTHPTRKRSHPGAPNTPRRDHRHQFGGAAGWRARSPLRSSLASGGASPTPGARRPCAHVISVVHGTPMASCQPTCSHRCAQSQARTPRSASTPTRFTRCCTRSATRATIPFNVSTGSTPLPGTTTQASAMARHPGCSDTGNICQRVRKIRTPSTIRYAAGAAQLPRTCCTTG
jgi:hypothetical protein